jgi:hypothetical protein
MSLKRILLAKPYDLRLYQEANVTGLTVLLYMTPWSVSIGLTLTLIAVFLWGPK